jgi:hypothetical protein
MSIRWFVSDDASEDDRRRMEATITMLEQGSVRPNQDKGERERARLSSSDCTHVHIQIGNNGAGTREKG